MSSTTSSRVVLFAALLAQAQAQPKLYEAVEPHMGTLLRIKLYAATSQQASLAFRSAFQRIHELDEILSDYSPSSELSQLTRKPAGQPIPIGPDLFRVLEISQQLAQESDGAFDVTIGPLTHLWRQARKNGRPPGSNQIQQAQQRCGYQKLHLDPARRTVRFDLPGMELDAGGIGKGFAADAALEVLTRLGIRSALVAASGDLAFSNPPPGQHGWKIGIDTIPRVLELSNAAVSTSGASEQHLDFGGQRYSHIIDPLHGSGITHDVTVSVIAPQGILADALSTALSVLSAERGLDLARSHQSVSAAIREGPNLQLLRLH